MPDNEHHELMTTGEVAAAFGVSPGVVSRWVKDGKFPTGAVVRTLGGHRRYKTAAIEQLLQPGSERQS